MGGSNQKDKPKPQLTMDEQIMNMKMAARRFMNESKRAEKERNVLKKKAEDALKKDNEEGAKLFLQTAAAKEQQHIQMLRMAHKMEAITGVIKNSSTQTNIVQHLQKITPLLTTQSDSIPIETLVQTVGKFDEAMMEIEATGKVMSEAIEGQTNAGTSDTVDMHLEQLREKIGQERQCQLNPTGTNQMAYLPGQQQFQMQQNTYQQK